jgi:hypothetical protein
MENKMSYTKSLIALVTPALHLFWIFLKWILFQLYFYEFNIFTVITNTSSKKKKLKGVQKGMKKGIKMAQYKNSTERAVMFLSGRVLA